MPENGAGTAGPSEVEHCLGDYRIITTTAFGPRLLGLRRGDGPQVFARLDPDLGMDTGAGPVRFRGGHRLWSSPEIPHLTHIPDDHPCRVTLHEGVLRVAAPVDAAGFVKEIRVRAEGDRLVVDHRLAWTRRDPVAAGPWGITQLPLGGIALLPIPAGRTGYRADRSLVLWPYTDLADPRLSFRTGVVLVRARAGRRLKVGSGPAPGKLAYLRDGWLFIKTVEPGGDADLPDRGAAGQVFCGEDFCELESLGPLVRLAPASDVSHREVWHVVECPDVETALSRMGGDGA